MTVQRCALLDSANKIENVVVADPLADHFSGFTMVADTAGMAQIGGSWNGTAFLPPPAPVLSSQQQAAAAYAAAIAAGCRMVSTASPGLNGTYPLNDSAIAKMTAIAAGIAGGKGLPGGGSTFNLFDASGAPHAIGSSDYLNLAAALETYVYDLIAYEMALAGGQSPTPPAQPVVIL